ncbi:unnamed protein product [Cylindrotheca closterium]|uniref:Uncharacterized protein n=1 Tax=Cylindrotheca closterium TaxID=2856 RepID=A0AAD2FV34_9STRA|nr:unnamed protein product [Cylindrotheca closterium]
MPSTAWKIESSEEKLSRIINLPDDQEIVASLCGMSLGHFQKTQLSRCPFFQRTTVCAGFEIVVNEELDHNDVEWNDCDASLGKQRKNQRLPCPDSRTAIEETYYWDTSPQPCCLVAPQIPREVDKKLEGVEAFWQQGVLHGVYDSQASCSSMESASCQQ